MVRQAHWTCVKVRVRGRYHGDLSTSEETSSLCSDYFYRILFFSFTNINRDHHHNFGLHFGSPSAFGTRHSFSALLPTTHTRSFLFGSVMHFTRRISATIAAITVLISISVLAVISIGEGFKVLIERRDDIDLARMDGTVASLSMRRRQSTPASVIDSFVGAISSVAGMLAGVGSLPSDVVHDMGESLPSPPTGTINLGMANFGGAGISSSAVAHDVMGVLGETSPPIGSVVEVATSVVGGILATASEASNVGVLGNSVGSLLSSSSSSAASPLSSISSLPAMTSSGFGNNPSSASSSGGGVTSIPQMSSRSGSGSMIRSSSSAVRNILSSATNATAVDPTVPPHNSTTLAKPIVTTNPLNTTLPMMQNGTNSTAPRPMNTTLCTTLPLLTTSCPVPVTETCTVTETWHSTHYAETATLFSFMSIVTVTCTETIKAYPTDSPLVELESEGRTVICDDGSFVKSEEECQSNSGSGSAARTRYSYSSPIPAAPTSSSPIDYVMYMITNGSSRASSTPKASSIPSFTVSLPSKSMIIPPVLSGTSGLETIMCKDGSLVAATMDCLNGLADKSTSSVLSSKSAGAVHVGRNMPQRRITSAKATDHHPKSAHSITKVPSYPTPISKPKGANSVTLTSQVKQIESKPANKGAKAWRIAEEEGGNVKK
ncbi:hypothetical protein BGZ60DRAFT_38291 [Tricladium varicosporioides]|nr:hypothetical protein BGZ60DRAFT_38291 [Hymenoscyphus varicosporioides]